MKNTRFGSTELMVSPICVGTWSMGGGSFWGASDDGECIAAIHAMLERGVNIIDTAPAYNGGRAEELVGKAVADRRDKVCIVTKSAVFDNPDPNGMPINDGTYQSILRQAEDSLRRLGTDYVDVLLMHWPDPATPLEESMRAYAELKKSGKARYIGVSNFTVEQLEEANRYCKLDVFQLPYSLVDTAQKDRAEWAHAQGMANMSYGSLGGGILTGAYRTLPTFPEKDARSCFYQGFHEPYFSKVMGLLKIMDRIAEAHGTTPAQVAVKWINESGLIDTAIVGVRSVKKAIANCEGLDWSMAEAEWQELEAYRQANLG